MEHEATRCDLCGSRSWTDFKKFTSLYNDQAMNFVRCNHCHLVYANPQPGETWLRNYYQAERTPEYFDKCFGETAGKSAVLAETISPFVARGSRILDVGCSIGLFLHACGQRGWNICGIEPNINEVRYARKRFGTIDISEGYLSDRRFPGEYFDLVTLWDVIEHDTSPTRLIGEINRILKPDGILAFTAPNVDSYLAGQGSPLIWGQGHLYLFTNSNLDQLLRKSGFAPHRTMMNPYFPSRDARIKDWIKQHFTIGVIATRRLISSPFARRFLMPRMKQSGFTIIARKINMRQEKGNRW